MNKIVLSTGSDQKYLQKIQKYLESIELNSNFDLNVLVCLDFDSGELESEYKNVKFSNLESSKLRAINSNNCLQHGEFLSCGLLSTLNDNDIIIFTDGDVFLQRPADETELNFLRNLKNDEIFVGFNNGPTDTLNDEYHRLSPTGIILIENYQQITVYNTGILCMNKKTWSKLLEKYVEKFPLVDKMFRLYPKQQWLLSYLFKDFDVKNMGSDFHNHDHFGVVEGTKVIDKTVYFNNKKSLFRHKWLTLVQ